MAKFLTPVMLELLEETGERPTWRTIEPIVYQSDLPGIGTFTVPEDFICDLASIPRIPLAWLVFGGRGIRASILHDYAYDIVSKFDGVKITREQADLMFREALIAGGEPEWRAQAMFDAVRQFGEPHWRC